MQIVSGLSKKYIRLPKNNARIHLTHTIIASMKDNSPIRR